MTAVPTRPSVLALLALLLLAGCASVPLDSAQEDARGKQFVPPPPDRGSLYVYRQGPMGAPVSLGVTLAGRGETRLAQDTFVWLEPAPGAIDVRCAGTDGDGGADTVVNVGPGETRFVEVAYRLGLMGSRCAVTEVAEAQGRAAVLAGKRAVGP
jgi:hypothetical protein